MFSGTYVHVMKSMTMTQSNTSGEPVTTTHSTNSREADAGQEATDQTLVLSADAPLEGGLHPVLDVAHLPDAAGVPADGQGAQRGPQHKVVLPQLAGGAEDQHGPQPGVPEDLAELPAGQRQAPPFVLVQEGEEVQQTLAVQLDELHGWLVVVRER